MGRGEETRRRGAPRRTLIRPLVMLATGAVTGVVAWRILMMDGDVRPPAMERLSIGDRHAVDALLRRHAPHP